MWMGTHMLKEGPFISKDITWPQRFSSLTSSSIKWYKRKWETKNIILHCGGFPNVPLMGTRGCNNYKLVLCMRQFGHAMNGPSKDKDLVPFVINDVNPTNLVMRRVRKAWTKIIRSSPDIGRKNIISREPYI